MPRAKSSRSDALVLFGASVGFPPNRGGFLIGFKPLIGPHPGAIRVV
jgi:hypothetical protein